MAGHSKWANIKRRKAVVDAAKSKVWTKVIREINVAAREGGGDPAGNPRLSLAIDAAKAANMPKDNIERAIKKGIGDDKDAAQYVELLYEGYGPGGIAYMVEATSDNTNRTAGEIRHIFSKYGASMGTSGSVAYMFDRVGLITIKLEGIDEDEITLAAIEAGAEDIKTEDEVFEITTRREDLFAVRNALEQAGYTIASAELQYIPGTMVKVDEETALGNFKLMEKLEENDDV
ncbi:MAG: YebC/PmpR family DNA-binding transcriptional regulator, partial [Balneolales bacterium]|nr:YebC/PmpR family DNA-binding transcriptional regulator [Balneolales bacterium]